MKFSATIIDQLDGNLSLPSSDTSSEISSILHEISGIYNYASSDTGLSVASSPDSVDSSGRTTASHYHEIPQSISVITGYRPTTFHDNKPRKRFLTKIDTNTREKVASNLPNISVINARSLWPKIKSFATQFVENNTQVAILTEIWGKGSKKEVYKITELLELRGINLIYDLSDNELDRNSRRLF